MRETAVPLKDLVQKILSSPALRKVGEDERVRAAWEAVVGAEAARHTGALGLRSGALVVRLDSPSWMQELHSRGIERLASEMRDRGIAVRRVSLGLG